MNPITPPLQDSIAPSAGFRLDTARALCAACANTYAAPFSSSSSSSSFSENANISTPLCHATVTRFAQGSKLQVEGSPRVTGSRLKEPESAAAENLQPSTFTPSDGVNLQPYTVLAFRGSKSLRDWLTDFQFRRVRTDSGDLVHEGFYRAWLSVRNLLPNTPPLQHSSTPLVVTGHSLGGAMALLAAEGLFKRGFPIAAVYTFGGPRVGDGAWAMGYDIVLKARTWRLVDELDLVPRVPFLGFMHAGNRVQLSDNGLFVNPPLWQLLGQDGLQMYRAWRARRLEQLTDHPISAYTNRLAAYLPTQIF